MEQDNMNKKNTLAFLILIMLSSSFPALADLKMGVFPRRPVAVTHKAFRPLAEALSKKLGEKVILIVPKDFKAFWRGVKSGQFDIVHYNQYHYIVSHKKMGYKVIAVNEEFGSKLISGALTVRKDSGIKSISDLKGKTILFGGGKKAMGSYIAPTAILKKAGLVAGKDYTVRFAKNPPSAVIAVYNKAADAAGSGNVILKTGGVRKKTKVDDLRILGTSESFIHLTWAVKGSMSDAKVKKIQSIMTGLSSSAGGKAILKSARVNAFHIATDADFAKVRSITEYAIGEKY
jgi:phosphonate transport system substrate-binding protein